MFTPYGKQFIDKKDKDAVLEVLCSDFLTQGPKVVEFEKMICRYTGAKYCVAVSNGTAALHLAVAALEIDKGGEGITSPITFVASANCLLYSSLKPIFADIDEQTCNIDPGQIEKRITKKTKILIPVHFAGRVCEMAKIQKIARNNNLKIIEDAAHAIGSNYPGGGKVGSCKYSDLTTFSFHPVKTITTGEGGAITTNNKKLYDKLLLLRTHGITKDASKLKKNPGPWYYEMQTLGYNYRLTDIQAALGISQLDKLENFKKKRLEIIKRYNKAFLGIPIIEVPPEEDLDLFAFHLYFLRIDFRKTKISRSELMTKLYKKNIGTQVHYIPVHLQPYYKKLGHKKGDYPVSERYYGETLSLPLYPSLTIAEQSYIIKSILELIK